LPIIDPTVVLAFILGIVFCFPVGKWIAQLIDQLVKESSSLRFPIHIIYDFILLLLFVISIASLVSNSFAPGLYGKF
jgi:uncharacterized membrane protein YcjF (UPF0283 family)